MSDEKETYEHPRGALLFILAYLLALAVLWTDVYLRLFQKV
jgi:hypothetical protein